MPTFPPDVLTTGGVGTWLLAVLIVAAAGCIQGFTGMGFAVVATPLLVFFVPQPHQVIMLSLSIGVVLSAAVLIETRRALSLRTSWLLIAGAVLGTPLGVVVLSHVDPRGLTILIAVTALATAAIWMIRRPSPVRHERTAVLTAGLLGGFLNGATSMGGPPPALVVSMQRWEVAKGRAALAAFNLTSYLIGIATGISARDVGFLVHGVWLLPVAVLGTLFGAWCSHRLPAHIFRSTLLCTVVLAGLFALASAIRA